MIGRVALTGMIVVGLMVGAAGSLAAAPEGPRLAFIEWSEEHHDFALLSTSSSGGDRRTLAGGRFSRQVYEEAPFGERLGTAIRVFPFPIKPSWTPDGSRIAFDAARIDTRSRHRWRGGGTFAVGADGRGLRLIRAAHGIYPVFAPDGRTIAFARDGSRLPPLRTSPADEGRYERTSVWSVRIDGSHLHQLTPWRNGIVSIPSSFSPDGSTLAITQLDLRRARTDVAAVAVRVDGSGETTLAVAAEEPVYSPDGSEVAFLSVHETATGFLRVQQTDLVVAAADGSGARTITDTPSKIERSPSWDPSGERLAYMEYRRDASSENGDSIAQINADGTCLSTVVNGLPQTGLYGPVWQPGPGRAAWRIAC